MQKITPHLWFAKEPRQAAEFYIEIFGHDSRVLSTAIIPGTPAGDTEVVNFKLRGIEFVAINGDSDFRFNESISFIINCESQEEIDYFWKKLSAVPEAEICGWLKDKYGLSWQVVPIRLSEMLADDDKNRIARVTKTFLKMKKIEISKLEKAYNNDGN